MRFQTLTFTTCLFMFLACRKDPPVVIAEPVAPAVDNDLISGGGTSSFQRIIGGEYLDALYSVKQTGDGGYIFCGFTKTDSASERSIFFLKTDAEGEISWNKNMANDYAGEAWCVGLTSDGGFILASLAHTVPSGFIPQSYAGQLIKTDGNGGVEWKQTYTFGSYTHFVSVAQTADGGYLVCGTDYEANEGIMLKTNGSGLESWRKTYDGIVEINEMDALADGGFILCGSIKDSPGSPSSAYIIRTTPGGDTLWTKIYGDASDNSATSVKETATGNFILCGFSANPGGVGFVRLLDANGEEIWYAGFSSLDVQTLDDIVCTQDGQFVAVGRNGFSAVNKACLLKVDGSGNEVWIRWFEPRSYTVFHEVQQTADFGFVVAGYALGDGYILKTDSEGN